MTKSGDGGAELRDLLRQRTLAIMNPEWTQWDASTKHLQDSWEFIKSGLAVQSAWASDPEAGDSALNKLKKNEKSTRL